MCLTDGEREFISDPGNRQIRLQAEVVPSLRASVLLKRVLPLVLGAAICWPGRTHASETMPGIEEDAFSIQGFGTLGMARSSNGDAHILRSIRQPKGIGDEWSARQDSLLGVQAQYRFNEQVDAQIQAASYYREDGSFRPDVTAAFLKFDLDPRFSVRVGRVGLDLLMLADTRMVGYSYIPIRPVSESYNVPLNYLDGVSARWRMPIGEGVMGVEGTAGVAREDLPHYEFSGSKGAKGSIDYQIGAWQFRYFYARAKLAHENESLTSLRQGLSMTPARRLADKLKLEGTTGTYESLGVGYDNGDWQLQMVFDAMRYENPALPNGSAFHCFVGRRIGNVTPYVGYSRARTDPKKLETGLPALPWYQPLNAGLAEAMAVSGPRMDSETFTLGTRWDFRRNMALKTQVDLVRGGKSVSMLVDDTDPGWNGKTTMVSVSLDFVF